MKALIAIFSFILALNAIPARASDYTYETYDEWFASDLYAQREVMHAIIHTGVTCFYSAGVDDPRIGNVRNLEKQAEFLRCYGMLSAASRVSSDGAFPDLVPLDIAHWLAYIENGGRHISSYFRCVNNYDAKSCDQWRFLKATPSEVPFPVDYAVHIESLRTANAKWSLMSYTSPGDVRPEIICPEDHDHTGEDSRDD